MSQPTVADILAALPQEQRAIIEASLKRSAAGRAFQHVGYSQYYDKTTVEGEERNTPSGIENPNNLKISYTKKVGRRNAGMTISRGNDNTLSLANATFAPIESISLSRDGKLSLTLKDTFNDNEKQFIVAYAKSKFSPRPATTSATSTPATSTETDTSSDTTTTPAASGSAAPSAAQIKVAIIKSKKLKATDENVSLVQDLMKEGGMALDAAITELASAS